VYYCVDDFTEWPGYDGASLRRLEAELLARVDTVIAVSESLRERLRDSGRESHLLTHGVDPDFWSSRQGEAAQGGPPLAELPRPLVVFWGLLDRRMDVAFLRALSRRMTEGTVVLVGPQDNPDPEIAALPRVARVGQVAFEQLPPLAAESRVLVMPYADLPVTRAMQPLKLKEYLCTGKPVVVRDLPSTREWADCLDRAASAEEFARLVLLRLAEGLPPGQQQARGRLAEETWAGKAARFASWLEAAAPVQPAACAPGARG
jgi:glycosyltransferase involved in cell wall biosynthesis